MMCYESQTLNDPADIAECCSEHFCDIRRSLHECIQSVTDSPLQYVNGIENSFVNTPITEFDVRAFSKNEIQKSRKRLRFILFTIKTS